MSEADIDDSSLVGSTEKAQVGAMLEWKRVFTYSGVVIMGFKFIFKMTDLTTTEQLRER